MPKMFPCNLMVVASPRHPVLADGQIPWHALLSNGGETVFVHVGRVCEQTRAPEPLQRPVFSVNV